jgi:flagellin
MFPQPIFQGGNNMRIQHNIAALNSNRQLASNNNATAKNLEKLSSGYRINRAGDDAAGLAISEKMRAQITGLESAQSNANDGISLVQTAEGALTEVHSMLNRMVELADQSANGTYDNDVDRANLQKELSSLQSEVNRISEGTNFNGITLLDGSMGSGTNGVTATAVASAVGGAANQIDATVDFEFSAPIGYTLNVNLVANGTTSNASWSGTELTINLEGSVGADYTQKDIDALLKSANGTAPSNSGTIGVAISDDINITTATAATTALITGAESEAAKLATYEGDTAVTNTDGAATNVTFTSTVAGDNISAVTVSNTAADEVKATTAADGSVALNLDATTTYSATEINSMLSSAGADMTVTFEGSLTGANILGGEADAVYTLADGAGLEAGGGLVLQIGDTSESFNQLSVSVGAMDSTSLGIGSIDISTQSGAQDAIALIKTAINTVSSTRGNLGAIQNRLEHTINNLSVTSENMTSAESRIRDVDMAKEMMEYTKNNILVQASQSMLAQANQLPQGVLQLLQ